MITMGDYALCYHPNANQISILLPQANGKARYTTIPTADRRTDVEEDELFPALALVKAVFEKKEEENV